MWVFHGSSTGISGSSASDANWAVYGHQNNTHLGQSIASLDVDGDGFSACVDDCDDASATAYPGAAYNEADPTLCMEDADGDGYGSIQAGATSFPTCITINMVDSFGDG